MHLRFTKGPRYYHCLAIICKVKFLNSNFYILFLNCKVSTSDPTTDMEEGPLIPTSHAAAAAVADFDPLSTTSSSAANSASQIAPSTSSSLVRVEFDPLSQPNPLSAGEETVPVRSQQQRTSNAAAPTTPLKNSLASATPAGEGKTKKLYSQYFRQYELLIE